MGRNTLHTDGGDRHTSRLWLFSSLLLVLLLCCAGSFAQVAAHFDYVQSTVADPNNPLPAMNIPAGVAVDANGNVYVADSGNNRLLLEAPVTSEKRLASNEVHSIPPTTFLVTVNHVPVVTDYGVINQTTGLNMVYVASAPQKGQYSVTLATGAYVFNSADFGTNVAISYAYTDVSNGSYAQSPLTSSYTNVRGIALDAAGNAYAAVTGLNRITYAPAPITATSVFKTAVFSLSGPQAVAADGNGNMYVADTGNKKVYRFKPFSQAPANPGYYLPANADVTFGVSPYTTLYAPTGVAVDLSGNVYIVDQGNSTNSYNHRVLKETLQVDGSYVESVVADNATTSAGFNFPTGIAVDTVGNLYIADTNNNRIVKEVPTGTGSYTQIAITTNGLMQPTGVAVDAMGILYIADSLNNRVVKLQTNGVNFGSFAASSTGSPLSAPQRLVFTFDASGTLASTAYSVMTLGASSQDFKKASTQPTSQCVTSRNYNAGDICTVDVTFGPYSASMRYGAVVLYGSSNAPIATAYLYGNGTGPQLAFAPATQSVAVSSALAKSPNGVAADANTSSPVVYVADTNNSRILKGTVAISGATVSVSTPKGVALDGAGNLYVADTGNNRVVKETLQSNSTYVQTVIADTSAAFGLASPAGVVVDELGNVYVADTGNNRVVKETLSGSGYIQSVVADNSAAFGLLNPTGVAVDSLGNVYIADAGNNRVVKEKLQINGTYTQSLVADSTAGLFVPSGVAVDGNGNVFIADTSNNRVVKEALQSDGTYVQSVMADSSAAFGLLGPVGVAIGGNGNLYIADTSNNRVLKEDYATTAHKVFNATSIGTMSTDSPWVVTLLNIGNQPMSIMKPTTGTNPSVTATAFVLDSSSASACPSITSASASAGVLAVNSSCTLTVYYEPLTAGTPSGSLNVVDNNLTATSTTTGISLQGGTATKGTPTVTLTSSPAPSAYTQSVTFTAVVTTTVTSSVIPVPTGTITFADGSNTIPECSSAVTITNGQATCTTTSLSMGSHTITASYTPDTNSTAKFNPASIALIQTVNQATPTLTVTGPTSITYGNSGTATYSLNPATGDAGTVSFTASGGGCTVSGTAVSIVDMSLPCILKASVTGDTNYLSADSAAYTVTLKKASPTITVTGPGSVTYGAPGTAAATVVTPTGFAADSGAVVFSAGNSTGCAVSGTTVNVTNTSGTCSLTATVAADINYAATTSAAFPVTLTPAQLIVKADDKSRVFAAVNPTFTGTAQTAVNGDALTVSATTLATAGSPVGTYPIVPAVTGANASNYAVTLVNGTLTIAQATPTVALTASSSALPPGLPVTLTATVPADATGTVTFMDGAATLGTGNVSGWTATLSTSALAVGTHSITAMYSGDKNYASTSSPAFTVSVTKTVSPLVTLTSSASPSVLGQSVTLTATVPPGATGTVAFQDNASAIAGCGVVAVTGAAAGCTTSALTLGAHSITAVYSGDTNNASATSSTLVLAVTDFAIATSQPKQQTSSGASATYPISLTSVGGTFTNAVTLSVTGLPAGATASFSPATVTPGTGGMTSILTITVPKQVAGGWIKKAMRTPFALAMLFFPLQFLMTGARKRRLLLFGLLVLGLTAGLASCGGSTNKSTSSQQQPQSYVLTVTGTSGVLSHSTTITMTVQ